jgi:hypothetical protein
MPVGGCKFDTRTLCPDDWDPTEIMSTSSLLAAYYVHEQHLVTSMSGQRAELYDQECKGWYCVRSTLMLNSTA